MHSPFRGRSHTKKQHNNFKPKISAAERKKRKQQKQIANLFPPWKHFLPCYASKDKSKTHEVKSPGSFAVITAAGRHCEFVIASAAKQPAEATFTIHDSLL